MWNIGANMQEEEKIHIRRAYALIYASQPLVCSPLYEILFKEKCKYANRKL